MAISLFMGSAPWAYCPLAGRGRILFFFGLRGGGMTSVLPPRAVIFAAADLEK
jgi:hypothetical protein